MSDRKIREPDVSLSARRPQFTVCVLVTCQWSGQPHALFVLRKEGTDNGSGALIARHLGRLPMAASASCSKKEHCWQLDRWSKSALKWQRQNGGEAGWLATPAEISLLKKHGAITKLPGKPRLLQVQVRHKISQPSKTYINEYCCMPGQSACSLCCFVSVRPPGVMDPSYRSMLTALPSIAQAALTELKRVCKGQEKDVHSLQQALAAAQPASAAANRQTLTKHLAASVAMPGMRQQCTKQAKPSTPRPQQPPALQRTARTDEQPLQAVALDTQPPQDESAAAAAAGCRAGNEATGHAMTAPASAREGLHNQPDPRDADSDKEEPSVPLTVVEISSSPTQSTASQERGSSGTASKPAAAAQMAGVAQAPAVKSASADKRAAKRHKCQNRQPHAKSLLAVPHRPASTIKRKFSMSSHQEPSASVQLCRDVLIFLARARWLMM